MSHRAVLQQGAQDGTIAHDNVGMYRPSQARSRPCLGILHTVPYGILLDAILEDRFGLQRRTAGASKQIPFGHTVVRMA